MHLTSTSGSKIILSKSRQFNIVMTWGTIGFSMYTAEIWIFRLCHAKPYIFFSWQVRKTTALDFCIDFYFTKVRTVQYLRDLRHYQILNVCSRDLLTNPRRTLQNVMWLCWCFLSQWICRISNKRSLFQIISV